MMLTWTTATTMKNDTTEYWILILFCKIDIFNNERFFSFIYCFLLSLYLLWEYSNFLSEGLKVDQFTNRLICTQLFNKHYLRWRCILQGFKTGYQWKMFFGGGGWGYSSSCGAIGVWTFNILFSTPSLSYFNKKNLYNFRCQKMYWGSGNGAQLMKRCSRGPDF